MCVQIQTVCELTHGVQNYTVVPFSYNMKKMIFFTLTPWLVWLTNMRYEQHNLFLIYALLSRIELCRDYALFGGHFWRKLDGRGGGVTTFYRTGSPMVIHYKVESRHHPQPLGKPRTRVTYPLRDQHSPDSMPGLKVVQGLKPWNPALNHKNINSVRIFAKKLPVFLQKLVGWRISNTGQTGPIKGRTSQFF